MHFPVSYCELCARRGVIIRTKVLSDAMQSGSGHHPDCVHGAVNVACCSERSLRDQIRPRSPGRRVGLSKCDHGSVSAERDHNSTLRPPCIRDATLTSMQVAQHAALNNAPEIDNGRDGGGQAISWSLIQNYIIVFVYSLAALRFSGSRRLEVGDLALIMIPNHPARAPHDQDLAPPAHFPPDRR